MIKRRVQFFIDEAKISIDRAKNAETKSFKTLQLARAARLLELADLEVTDDERVERHIDTC